MANFYAIGSCFSLIHYHSKECKDLTIEDDTSQPSDVLALGQK